MWTLTLDICGQAHGQCGHHYWTYVDNYEDKYMDYVDIFSGHKWTTHGLCGHLHWTFVDMSMGYVGIVSGHMWTTRGLCGRLYWTCLDKSMGYVGSGVMWVSLLDIQCGHKWTKSLVYGHMWTKLTRVS